MITLASPSSQLQPSTLTDLVEFLSRRGQPALSQYVGDERVEISGKVLTNWFNKTVNLFSAHFGALSPHCVLILPPHWKTFFIALAIKASGSEVLWVSEDSSHFAEDSLPAGVSLSTSTLFTHHDGATVDDFSEQPDEIVHVELATFAQAFEADMDPFGLDFAQEVPSQPDQLLVPLTNSDVPEPAPGGVLMVNKKVWESLGDTELDSTVSVTEAANIHELFQLALSHWAAGASVSITDAKNAEAALRQEKPSKVVVY